MSQAKPLFSRVFSALWEFLNRLIIFLGLPLLGWGLYNLHSFFSNPARLVFSILIVIQSFIIAWLVFISPPHPEHEHRVDILAWHLIAFEITLAVAAYGDSRNVLTWEENLPLRWVGLGIFLLGAGVSLWANFTWVRHLLREGSRSVDSPVLLTEGPYLRIRYPNMLYLFLYCLGFTLLCRSWAGLVLLLILVYGIIQRCNILDQEFADRYKTTWPIRSRTSHRIIPFLY